MKWISYLLMIIAAPLLCGAAIVVAYVLIVGLTIPQLPEWAQQGVKEWMLDVPQHSETSDNGSASYGSSSPAGMSAVKWKGYKGLDFQIHCYLHMYFQTRSVRQSPASMIRKH